VPGARSGLAWGEIAAGELRLEDEAPMRGQGAGAYASIGIRSGSREEHDFAAENGVRFVTSRKVHEKGI
jgi:arginase family enzyme